MIADSEMIAAEALAKYVARSLPTDDAIYHGHDLPSGAWRPNQGPA